ncbi:prepilin-type cleavage/methylation protein [Paucilactobacillus kaifaensis]|uniref:prepilin-type cleavage/methylation protein n=1 Tax=Paucilactobacillus kaifaensis TaxID=2559921 RepID=UPI0010F9E74A|nr:prepilin-type cleavage/methylation protein [Paucilactobacillus kaifaensis]
MYKHRISSIFCIIVTLIIFLLILLTLQSNPFAQIMPYHDSSMFLYFGSGIEHGLVPYTDMLDHKGPILFMINFFANIINPIFFNHGLFIFEIIFLVLDFYFLYKTSKLLINSDHVFVCSLFIMAPLVTITFGYGNYSEEYALTFIIIALYLFTKLFFQNGSLSSTSLFMIGFLGALTFFIRPNMIMLWVVCCIALLVAGFFSIKKSLLGRQTFWIFLGGLCVTVIVAVYGIVTNSLKQMISSSIILNFSYAGSSLSEKYTTAKYFINVLLHNNVGFVIAFYLIYLIIEYRSFSRKAKVYNLLVFFIAVLNFLTVILSGRQYNHYLITELPYLFIFSLFALNFIYEKLTNLKHLNLITMIIMLAFITPFVQIFKQEISYVNLETKSSYEFKESYLKVSSYIASNTNRNDEIYVHAIDANIYLQSKRFANSKLFVLPSLDYTKYSYLSSYFERKMKKNPPKYIAISNIVYESDHQNNKRMNKFMYTILKKNFNEVKKFKNNDILLFKLK